MIREREAKVLPLVALPTSMYLPTYLHVLISDTVTHCVEVDYFHIFIFDVNGVIFSFLCFVCTSPQ